MNVVLVETVILFVFVLFVQIAVGSTKHRSKLLKSMFTKIKLCTVFIV